MPRGNRRGRRNRGSGGDSARYAYREILMFLLSRGFTYEDIAWLFPHLLDDTDTGSPTRPESPDPPVTPPAPEQPKPKDVEVTGVDLQVPANTADHHTSEYDIAETENPSLVVRRGQALKIKVQLSKAFPSKDHDLRLVFEIGREPKNTDGSKVTINLSAGKAEGWTAKYLQKSGQSLEVSVVPSATCIVGKWNLGVTVVKNGQNTKVYRVPKPVYILFNPWCKEDVVYNASEEELEEYILDDTGSIFTGSVYANGPRSWVFGQFTGNVLDCSLSLLDSSDLNMQKRGDAIRVVRKLSALINSVDDDGVLMGNWSGDYSDGKSPSSWTGSVKILEQYYKDRKPVKFGQCWVFSGVLTTVCRALGIPCRSVTNFSSAHDTDASVTIDEHFDSKGKELEYMNRDSVWNFHVWNEVWLRRDELADGYSGWQACDATPQEASEGLYQCGPCPVRAIKEGDLTVNYDAAFIFAEVNADKVKWKQDEATQDFKPISHDRHSVGKKISTRALRKDRVPSWNQRNDVTKDYKYPDGSAQEQAAVLRAYKSTSSRLNRDAYDIGPEDVEFKVDFNQEPPVGEDFVVKLLCKNKSKELRTVSGHGSIRTMFYTGVLAERVGKGYFEDVQLKPGQSNTVEVRTTQAEYLKLLKDGCFLYFTASCMVAETKQSYIISDNVMLKKPTLSINAPKEGKVEQEFEMTVTFSNPTDSTLTDCVLEVEGAGVTKAKEYPQRDVAPHGTLVATVVLKPMKPNKRNIVVVFSSKQLDNVSETHEILVKA